MTSVSLLGHSGAVAWSQTPQDLEVRLPEEKPCEPAFALKVLGEKLHPSPTTLAPAALHEVPPDGRS